MRIEELSYDAALAKLQELNSRLASGDLTVDQLQASVKEADKLLQHCKRLLYSTQQTVEKIAEGWQQMEEKENE